MAVSSTGIKNPLGFAGDYGYQEDAETGLKLLGHRLYDPSIGRFLERDPIGFGMNWYGYCKNNPLKSVDPLGKEIRELTAKEREDVQRGIDDLKAHGETKAASDLQDMLNRGRIKVDTEITGAEMETDPDGNTIYIHADAFDTFCAPARLKSKRDPSAESKASRRADQLYFASLLLHEWVHTKQGRAWKGFHPHVREENAWLRQMHFLIMLMAMQPANPNAYQLALYEQL